MDAVKDALEQVSRYRTPEEIRLVRAVVVRVRRALDLELKASIEAEAARRLAAEAGVARED
jgi:hypothetical protein